MKVAAVNEMKQNNKNTSPDMIEPYEKQGTNEVSLFSSQVNHLTLEVKRIVYKSSAQMPINGVIRNKLTAIKTNYTF